MPNNLVLGSLSLQAPTLAPESVHVSPTICHDLSLFKDLLRDYRKLDDSITMRLNRANALVRDTDRLDTSPLPSTSSTQDQACIQVWRELVANWKRRTELVTYCVTVVDKSIEEKRKAVEEQGDDPVAQRRTRALLYSDEVKKNQVHNELSVEKIVRHRSLDAFRTRCKYFKPSESDSIEEKKLWESAQR